MNPNAFEFFSVAHKYGLPPHGGFGLGLEKFTQKDNPIKYKIKELLHTAHL